MSFLQPLMLLGLPLIALPIAIHLLNRMRYRPQAWAAMRFLKSTSRRSRRYARLRHWLILACRVLVVTALILALARPLVGGWLGWTLRGGPDTVVLLLDRSPSMETRVGDETSTKLQAALSRLIHTGQTISDVRQLVLIDSATLVPQELEALDALPLLSSAEPCDRAADIPQLLAAAVAFLSDSQAGTSEIWLVSDFQASNWKPLSPRWTSLSTQLAALPQEPRVRLLAFSEPAAANLAVRIRELVPVSVGGEHHLDLVIEIDEVAQERIGDLMLNTFPLSVVVGGVRRPLPVTWQGPSMRIHHRVTLGPAAEDRWGFVELPADANLRDNRAYFVFHPRQQRHALVVSENPDLGALLGLAVAPSSSLVNLSATVVSPEEVTATTDLSDTSLVIWQAQPPLGQLGETLSRFVDQGGVVVAFPPSGNDPVDRHESMPWAWSEIQVVPSPDRPDRVIAWEETDGLLAQANEGTSLLVNELVTLARRSPVGNWSVLASYDDGTLFLGRKALGRGRLYACATLPVDDWSNLGEGMVLVPMIQRALQEGVARFGLAANKICGDTTALAEARGEDPWHRVDDTHGSKWIAGIYRSGQRWVALNRSPDEDQPETIDQAVVKKLLDPVTVDVFDASVGNTNRLSSEIWRVCLGGVLVMLLIEALLLWPGLRKKGGGEAGGSGYQTLRGVVK